MSYYIVDRMGGGEREDRNDPPVSRMLYHLSSFDPNDREHECVTLNHRESGWGIAVFESGLLILEQMSDVPPRHMRVADRQKILSLWKALAAGDIDAVMAEPWAPGYGS